MPWTLIRTLYNADDNTFSDSIDAYFFNSNSKTLLGQVLVNSKSFIRIGAFRNNFNNFCNL